MAAVDGEQKPIAGKEFNWAVKYQPKTLKDFICHKDIAQKLETLMRKGEGDHFIIEGPPGVGKRTLALAMLREKLGVDILETRLEFKTFNMEVSSEHIELDLSGLKEYAADMVMMLIEEGETGLVKQQSCSSIKLMSKQLFFARQKIFRNIPPTPYQKLLGKLRRSLCSIFCCYDILTLQNLCPLGRVIELHPPPDAEILGALNFIAKQDDIQLPHQLAQTMAQKSKNCLQQAIRSFEATLRSG
ncbi:hypothetical protein SLEP1_g22010 [Rubroshorea leprosula]|nr:hypothetical protein SLEP1_g22010 [Rubroshorea leprosula]